MRNKNENKLYKVYCHTNKINGKKYIGITCRTLNERWRHGEGYIGQPFYSAINKYGWNGFKHEILFENVTCEYACNKEIELIKEYKTYNNKFGYNADMGGFTGYYFTEEQKNKASKRFSGGNNPMSKKVYCDGMIFQCLEDCARFYNKTPNTISNWINGKNGIPNKFKNMNLRYIGEIPKYKIRQKYGMNRKTICDGVVFNTATDCANYYNIKPSTMTKWLNGTNKIPIEYLNMGLKYLDKEQNTNVINEEDNRKTKLKCIEINKEFNSISECIEYFKKELDLKLFSSEISRIINNKRKSTKGYTFTKIS